MMEKYYARMIIKPLVFAAFLVILSRVFSACASGESPVVIEEMGKTENQEIPRIVIKSFQEAVYNGKPQPISLNYSGEEKLYIIYYPSQEARKENRQGSTAAPVRAGTYYARVKNSVEEVFAEYRILKRPVKIEAEGIQHVYYNGNPKRVWVRAEPPVSLSYSYYPNQELRETAQKAAQGTASEENSAQVLVKTFRGYRRVDRAPIEQGTYYVWVFFPGDENHEAAHANVEFIILPSPR